MKYSFTKYIRYHRRHTNQHPYIKLFTHSPFSISSTWTGIVFSYIKKIPVANLPWTLRSLLPPAPELRPFVDSVTLSSRGIGVDGSDDRRRSSGITSRACRNVLTTSGLFYRFAERHVVTFDRPYHHILYVREYLRVYVRVHTSVYASVT